MPEIDLHAEAPTQPNTDAQATGAYAPSDGTADGTGSESKPVFPRPEGYEILGVLGRGGMGVVYKARQTALKRVVALKMILAGGHAGPEQLGRFRAEAEAVARLQHPNIVQIYEIGADAGCPFFSLEYVDGGSLAQQLHGAPQSPRAAAQLVQTLAEAIHYAHQHGVIHRDLKPANILLTGSTGLTGQQTRRESSSHPVDLVNPVLDEFTPKITDFGLAKQLDDDSGQTRSGSILGTPSYMAPEQAAGRTDQIGPAADIYSLGAILYCLLTGRPPFQAATAMETLKQVLEQEPVPPRQLNPAVPRDLETICLKAIAKEPGRRYPTGRDLADDLRRFLKGEPIQARAVGQVERFRRWCRRKPLVASLTAAVAFVLVAGTTVATYFAIDATLARDQADVKAKEALDNAKRADAEALNAKNKAKEAQENAQKEADERKRADREADDAWANQYVAHMNLVQLDYENLNLKRMLDTLEIYRKPPPARKDLRGWEWYYQERLCSQELSTLKGHGGPVASVAFSPDQARLASASQDRTVKLWDAASGQVLRTFRGHTATVWCVAFSPDGARLASASSDGSVKLWDAASGRELRPLKGHAGAVRSVAFSPDGARLASAGHDHTVKLWDVASGQELHTLKGHANWVRNVAFSPDGARLASASSDRTVKLWNAASGQEIQTLKAHTQVVSSVAFSPDGTRLASASFDQTVKLWEADSGQEIRSFIGHKGTVRGVAFCPDGTRVASASDDRTVKLWDANSGQELGVLKGHASVVFAVSFSPDGARLASSSDDRTVRLWNAVPGQDLRTAKIHLGGVRSVAFSPDPGAPRRLALACDDRTVKLWDAQTGQEFRTLKAHTDSVFSVAFSQDGALLASASRDGSAKLWNVASGQQLCTLKGHTGTVFCVTFSPVGCRLASAGGDGAVKLWDPASAQELQPFKGHRAAVRSVAFSPDGARLASASQDQTVKLWDAASGQELRTLRGHTGWVTSVTFSPDGARIASASHDQTVKLWDAVSGQELRTLKGHTGFVYGVAFSPGGARLASASQDQTVKLWDAASGQELRTLKGHTRSIQSVAFSPDGNWLASASDDRVVHLWDARPLTPDVQAEVEGIGLLNFYFAKPLPKSDVGFVIQRDKLSSQAARQKALELAERFREETDPKKYHAAAWPVLRHPYANVFMCQFALAQTNAACERVPDRAIYRIALGVAQYRLGKFQKERYPEALATLGASDQSQPVTLAFLAMTQHHLRESAEAKATLSHLRQLLSHPQWSNNVEAKAFLHEAEALIEGTRH